jgi:hypothetical protein
MAAIWLHVATIANAASVAPSSHRRLGNGKVQSLAILAVDDDSLVLPNTVSMLEELGHKAYEAASKHMKQLRAKPH